MKFWEWVCGLFTVVTGIAALVMWGVSEVVTNVHTAATCAALATVFGLTTCVLAAITFGVVLWRVLDADHSHHRES